MPVPATVSSLAVGTPLHSAIWSRNTEMLGFLLSSGLDSNSMPLAVITRCNTPAMATIVHCDPWNEFVSRCLRQHPQLKPHIRTPIYDVHILRFAAARLSLSLLKAVAEIMSLDGAGVTALGHNLLHVACLPLDDALSIDIQEHFIDQTTRYEIFRD